MPPGCVSGYLPGCLPAELLCTGFLFCGIHQQGYPAVPVCPVQDGVQFLPAESAAVQQDAVCTGGKLQDVCRLRVPQDPAG